MLTIDTSSATTIGNASSSTTIGGGSLPPIGPGEVASAFAGDVNIVDLDQLTPGDGKRLSVELSAGKYVLICNVIGHYNSGQFAAFFICIYPLSSLPTHMY